MLREPKILRCRWHWQLIVLGTVLISNIIKTVKFFGLLLFIGGAVTVDEIVSMAKAKCQEANVDQPFMCLDLVYISVLLRDLFSLPSTHKINVS